MLYHFRFFFNDTATTEIYTLSLHDALPISSVAPGAGRLPARKWSWPSVAAFHPTDSRSDEHTSELQSPCNLVCRLLLEKKKIRRSAQRDLHANSDASWSSKPVSRSFSIVFFFFFNDTATTEIYTLSLHDGLPIWCSIRLATPLWPASPPETDT